MTSKQERAATPLCLPFAQWPEVDRLLWLAAITPTDPFTETGGTRARHRPISNHGIVRGYGRWLSFVASTDPSFASMPPAVRITKEAVIAYIGALDRSGNRNSTIITRLEELREAAKVMDPDGDWSFLGALSAKVRVRRDPMPDKPVLLVTSAELLDLGIELMRQAETLPVARQAAVLYRDGLIIGLLALRPLRRKNLAALTLGGDLTSTGSSWSILIPATASKTHVPLPYDWPPALSDALTSYLAVYRPLLVARTGRWRHDAGERLWISADGSPMAEGVIAGRVKRHTGQCFGSPISPHRFRHCAATTLAIHFSARVREAGPLLGDRDPRTIEQHYIRASGLEAHRTFRDHLAEARNEAIGRR